MAWIRTGEDAPLLEVHGLGVGSVSGDDEHDGLGRRGDGRDRDATTSGICACTCSFKLLQSRTDPDLPFHYTQKGPGCRSRSAGAVKYEIGGPHHSSRKRFKLLWCTVPQPRRTGVVFFLFCLTYLACVTLPVSNLWKNAVLGTWHSDIKYSDSAVFNLTNPAVLIRARHGAVATENELCSKLGVDILRNKNGNAVDAGVAATFCIGVVNLFSSGIGGGGFMTVRVPTQTIGGSSAVMNNTSISGSESSSKTSVWAIDFRETAPGASNRTMFVDNPSGSVFGGLSIAVPGEVRGLAEAHRRWGSVPWNEVVEPAAKLAEDGWKVGRELALKIRQPKFKVVIFRDPTWRAIFAPKGRLLREGEKARRPALAHTLRLLASKGANAFYEGPLADQIVSAVRHAGGIITKVDLERYEAIVYPALMGTYRGKRVYTPKAPTSGPVLLHMLNLLQKYDLEGEGRTGLNVHRFVEVMKFGFAARTRICDPEFADDISRIMIDEIPTKVFGDAVSLNITDNFTHTPDYYNPIFDTSIDHGTSHISVVDKDGMAAAITSTINQVFGSLVLDPVTGILFNDEMDDFSTPGVPNAFGLWPSPWNYPEPYKRPLSSTAPTIIERRLNDNSGGDNNKNNAEDEDSRSWEFYIAVGGSGGSKIFPAVAQVILGIDAWGLDASAAIEAGRVHDQLYPMEVEVDETLSRVDAGDPEDVASALKKRGHNVTVVGPDRLFAVVQVVMKDGNSLYASSDSRKNGIAAGY